MGSFSILRRLRHPRAVMAIAALLLALLAYFYPFGTPEACGQSGMVMSACVGQPATAMVAIVLAVLVIVDPKVIP